MIRPASATEPPRARRKLLMQALITAALILAFVGGLWMLAYMLGEDEQPPSPQAMPEPFTLPQTEPPAGGRTP